MSLFREILRGGPAPVFASRPSRASRAATAPLEGVQKSAPERDPRVYIADDDAELRASVAELLHSVALQTLTFADGRSLLEAYRHDAAPGCLLLDLRMPGMSGLEIFEALRGRGCPATVVIMSGYGEVGVAVRAMKAGVFDFIEKPFRGQDLIDIVQQALRHGQASSHLAIGRDATLERAATLTPREREVMELVVRGQRNKAIACRLGVSIRTVELHRARIMEKMGARTLPDLVRMDMLLPARRAA